MGIYQSRGSQASVLGPYLFLIYISDIVDDIGSNIHLFTPDTSLNIIVNDPETSAKFPSLKLKIIDDWAGK